MSNLAPVLPATISGSATVPIANQETTILILKDQQQQQQHPLSPTLTHPKQQSPIHITEPQTISDLHRNEIISINQLNLTNQKDPSLPSLVSKLATITCTAISSQLSPTKQLAAHRLFNTATIHVDESPKNAEEPVIVTDTQPDHHHHLVNSTIDASSRHSSSHSPPLEIPQNETTFTTSIITTLQEPSSYDSYLTKSTDTAICDNRNLNFGTKDDDDDVFTWKSPKTGTTFNIQLSTLINDNGNEVTTTTTTATTTTIAEETQQKLIKSVATPTRTPKISELTSSSVENDDENKCSSPAGGNLSLSLSPPVNRRREMPALRGPYVSL